MSSDVCKWSRPVCKGGGIAHPTEPVVPIFVLVVLVVVVVVAVAVVAALLVTTWSVGLQYFTKITTNNR